MKKKFVRVWLAILVLAILVLAARFLILEGRQPGLKEVLSQNALEKSFDPSLLVASLLAFSLAALSVSKGYEIFQRNRSVAVALIPEEEEEELKEEADPLRDIEKEELQKMKETLLDENAEYKGQIKRANAKLEEMCQVEQILRKSNIALGKECERLKAENEELTHKAKTSKMKPVQRKAKGRPEKSKKMKRVLPAAVLCFLLATAVFPQFSFYLIDNFEDGNFSEGPKWWRFGDLKVTVTQNPSPEVRDLIAESCGDYSLSLSGKTRDWYVGGIGTDLGVDASRFSRFQIDIYGNKLDSGKLKIELFDDDNLNYSIEQDPQKNYEPVYDDKWVAEVTILGRGFSRLSIPFSAFKEGNPGVGDDRWNPQQAGGSGGLLKMQLVAISADKEGATDFNIDNLLLTY